MMNIQSNMDKKIRK